jgi:glycosyltransferase involved in cell wall biosynthesis
LTKKNIFISAFNIHSGGGLNLLKELLSKNFLNTYALLDQRTKKIFNTNKKFFFAKQTVFSRIFQFLRLCFLVNRSPNSVLFCFNGLGPFFKINAKVICYVQTLYFTESIANYKFSFFVSSRIICEKIWFLIALNNIDEFWVQTEHMKKYFLKKYKKINPHLVKIKPFVDNITYRGLISTKRLASHSNLFNFNKASNFLNIKKNFFYPADYSPHKNHYRLVKAFQKILNYHKVKLFLTLPKSDFLNLKKKCNINNEDLKYIVNLGYLQKNEVIKMYKKNNLIFPSLAESFGLPLLEASNSKNVMLVSNLQYAKEFIVKTFFFNPYSINSIFNVTLKCIKKKKQKVLFKKIPVMFDGVNFFKELIA